MMKININDFMEKVDKMKDELKEVQKWCRTRLLSNDEVDNFVKRILKDGYGKAMIRSGAVSKNYAKRYWKPTTTVVWWEDGKFYVRRKLFAVKYGDDGKRIYYRPGEIEFVDELKDDLTRRELGLV